MSDDLDDPYNTGNDSQKAKKKFSVNIKHSAHKEILSQRSSEVGNKLFLNEDFTDPLGINSKTHYVVQNTGSLNRDTDM